MAKEEQNTNPAQPNRLESPERLNDYVRVTSVSPLLIGFSTPQTTKDLSGKCCFEMEGWHRRFIVLLSLHILHG